MLLHRYFSSHAFETLKEAKLKTSRISSFNDSFEFSYVIVGKPTPEQAKKSVPSVLCDPVFILGVIEANQKLQNPLSDGQIKKGLNNITEEDVARKWPDIVKQTELPLQLGCHKDREGMDIRHQIDELKELSREIEEKEMGE